jgi:hypothetical protein
MPPDPPKGRLTEILPDEKFVEVRYIGSRPRKFVIQNEVFQFKPNLIYWLRKRWFKDGVIIFKSLMGQFELLSEEEAE